VIGALMRRMHAAKGEGHPSVTIWGSGKPRRDFIYTDDLADACLFLMAHYDGAEPINLAAGTDVSIRELAELIRSVVGYGGDLEFDRSRPDGMPVKVLDGTPLARLGWRPATPLRDALASTYRAYLETLHSPRMAHV
jgi:GDP-L-fucose synthase